MKHFLIFSTFLSLFFACSQTNKNLENDSRKLDKAHERQSHPYHKKHAHVHGPECGHKSVKHNDHTDYIHDDHFHYQVGDMAYECFHN